MVFPLISLISLCKSTILFTLVLFGNRKTYELEYCHADLGRLNPVRNNAIECTVIDSTFLYRKSMIIRMKGARMPCRCKYME